MINLSFFPSLSLISANEWNACAHGKNTYNPFLSHAFLVALEQSGSTGGKTGWAGAHVAAQDETGKILGVAPTYIKSHSMGEYVFDHAWAQAYQQAGGAYYPKIQVCVPFTPVTGNRLLIHPEADEPAVRAALIAGLRSVQEQVKASSTHITFIEQKQCEALESSGFLVRQDHQFHWLNYGFDSFDAFLETLASRKRKAIRRERRDTLASDITIERLTGKDLTEAHWDAFYAFYQDTGARKWGRPYLTRSFFSLIGQSMAERILLILAKRNGRYIAGALNFIGSDALYGRNWGCLEDHPFLHFELCYYQAIDFAIEHGLARVEAGAQGEHKLARGYVPVSTWSAHDIADPQLRRAVAHYLVQEREAMKEIHAELVELTPFKQKLSEHES